MTKAFAEYAGNCLTADSTEKQKQIVQLEEKLQVLLEPAQNELLLKILELKNDYAYDCENEAFRRGFCEGVINGRLNP